MEVNVNLTDNSKAFLNALPDQIAKALEAIGLTAEAHAVDNITEMNAVDTGRLRGSISHARDDNAAYIGTNVEYAPYVELGTSKMAARPFLRNAAANHSDEYKSIVEMALKEE